MTAAETLTVICKVTLAPAILVWLAWTIAKLLQSPARAVWYWLTTRRFIR
jgi:hypothetical protein